MIDFFDWQKIDLTNISKASGEVTTLCPVCSPNRKKKTDKCLGVNLDTGIAHCCHCGVKSKRDVETPKNFIKSSYKLPKWSNNTNISDNMVKYFRERGISQQTLLDNQINEGKEFIHKDGGVVNCIKFPYIVNGDVVHVKYRSASKGFGSTKDTKKTLYGLDHLKGCKTAWICEGEFEKLSFYEEGIKNVVSVPNGVALSETEKEQYILSGDFNDNNTLSLEYINDSWEQIKHIEKWIICTDDDPAGKKLQRELIRRLGSENCEIADLRGYNDPNDLHKSDPLGLTTVKSKSLPLEGVFTIENEWDYIQDVRVNGYKKGLGIGIEAFDEHYTYRLGELDLIGGIPNHGKTTYAIWEMVITSVFFGWKWAIYSPENYPAGEFYISIIEVLLGKDVDERSDISATNSQMEYAKEFVSNHFYLIDWEDEEVMVTPEMILDKTKELIKRYGVNGLLIDPWNDLYHEFKNGENDAKYLQRILSKVRRFKRKYNIKTVINAHPTVAKQRESEDHPEQGKRPCVVWFFDVDGGAMWGNRMDNCKTIYRNTKDDTYRKTTEVHVQKIKYQKLVGVPTSQDEPILMSYRSNRFFINGKDPLASFDKKRNEEVMGEEIAFIDYASDFDNEVSTFDKIDSAPF